MELELRNKIFLFIIVLIPALAIKNSANDNNLLKLYTK